VKGHYLSFAAVRWYEIVGDPTLADAILDRLIHNSHRIALTGKSRRKPEAVE
jgi:DNA replication protein DnaC